MNFQVNPSSHGPGRLSFQAPKKPVQPSSSSAQAQSPQRSVDQLQAQTLPSGQSLNRIPLDTPALAPHVQKHLEKLEKILEPKAALSLSQKEHVLHIFKESQRDGSLPELVKQLDQKQQLLPLYEKMGSLVNRSPEASAWLGLVTLGLSWGEEIKHNRAFEMKKILTEAGISSDILKKLPE